MDKEMDALQALQQRVSVARLTGPVPDQQTQDNLFKAALRAPDHCMLRPWRFLTISGDAREALGELFVIAQQVDSPDMTAVQQQRMLAKPMRAPLIVVVIAVLTEHAKVPELEQLLSAGAAAQNMLVAAHAMGLGAIWRTGGMSYHPAVRQGLGLDEHERLLGFLYIGQIEGKTRLIPSLPIETFVTAWASPSLT
ncbi:MAG: nitroreductase [Candidatus Azotimanducaceae bacterium]|jgi:nitroreductase